MFINSFRTLTLRRLLFFFILFSITAYSNWSVCTGQFTGEDEPTQWMAVSDLIHAARQGDLYGIGRVVATQDQPPLRYMLSIPGVLVWPHSEFGLRFYAILFSFIMTYQVYCLGKEIASESVGIWSSLLIAASGVYNWTSMAFGWSVSVTCMILVIRLLRAGSLNLETKEGKKLYNFCNLIIGVMFLLNTGNILFFATLSLIALWENRKSIKEWLLFTSISSLFYVLYYIIFFGVVSLLSPTGQPVGQFAHNLLRVNAVFPGLNPFIANLKGINAYFLPYLSWIIFVFSLWTLIRHEKLIFSWISLFLFAWCFVFSVQTAQYFLLIFIAVFPFGIKTLSKILEPLPLGWVGAVFLGLVIVWNQNLFIRSYGSNDPAYPYQLLKLGTAEISRQHNIIEPYTTLVNDMLPYLTGDDEFVSDLGGSFIIFYFRNTPLVPGEAAFAGTTASHKFNLIYDKADHCYQPGWSNSTDSLLITSRNICPENTAKSYVYPRSQLRFYVLKNAE